MDYYDRFDSDTEEKSFIKRVFNQILWFIIFVMIFSISLSFLQPDVEYSKTNYLAAKKAREELEESKDKDKANLEKEKEDLVSQGKKLEQKNDALEEQLKKLDEEISNLK